MDNAGSRGLPNLNRNSLHTGAKYGCRFKLHNGPSSRDDCASGIVLVMKCLSFYELYCYANAIKYVGAKPVFAEINSTNYNLDVQDTERKITDKTKAILLVHQIGMPAAIDAFKELAKKYQLKLIEDAACAAGSAYKGAKIGSHSDLVCFSFHPRKVISTGDGGMITTNNESYYNRMKLLRQHGMSVNDRTRHESSKIIFEDHLEVGYNYRLTDIQASVGIQQLEKLDWIIAKRRKIALRYHKALKGLKYLQLPIEKKGYFSNYQSYSIYLQDDSPVSRNDIMQKMLDAGISTRRGIMTTHRETAYNKEYATLQLPVSEKASDRSIILPLYIPMKEEDIQKVIDTLLRYWNDVLFSQIRRIYNQQMTIGYRFFNIIIL
jgi:dTDP-4-amino-4,6-dideoxygalactose transaminase